MYLVLVFTIRFIICFFPKHQIFHQFHPHFLQRTPFWSPVFSSSNLDWLLPRLCHTRSPAPFSAPVSWALCLPSNRLAPSFHWSISSCNFLRYEGMTDVHVWLFLFLKSLHVWKYSRSHFLVIWLGIKISCKEKSQRFEGIALLPSGKQYRY